MSGKLDEIVEQFKDKAPELVNPPKVFDFYAPDMTIFLSLPKWLQDKMKDALDYGGGALERAVQGQGEGKVGEGSQEKAKASGKPKKAPKDEVEDDSIEW